MNNIITFENNKYEWKDLPTYGKCLVPYKEPEFLPGLKEGNIISIWGGKEAAGHVMVIRDYPDQKYSLLFLVGGGAGQKLMSWKWQSLEELKSEIKKVYTSVKLVDPKEVFKKLI